MSCQDHKLCHALPNQVHTLGHGVSVLNEEIIKIYSKPPFIARDALFPQKPHAETRKNLEFTCHSQPHTWIFSQKMSGTQ